MAILICTLVGREGVDSVRGHVLLVSLVVDVVLPVTIQRQALAVLFLLTVEVPQIQFFDVVGCRFLDMWVYIDKSLMCPWSCRAGSNCFQVSWWDVEECHILPTRGVALYVPDPWTLYLRALVPGEHLPWCFCVSLRLLLEDFHFVSMLRLRPSRSHMEFWTLLLRSPRWRTPFAQYFALQWIHVPRQCPFAFGQNSYIFL